MPSSVSGRIRRRERVRHDQRRVLHPRGGRRHDPALPGAGGRPLPVPPLGLRPARADHDDRCERRAGDGQRERPVLLAARAQREGRRRRGDRHVQSPARAQPRHRPHDREGEGLASRGATRVAPRATLRRARCDRRIRPSSACSMPAWPCSWSTATTISASRPCSRPRARRRAPSTITSRTRRTSRSRSSTSTCRQVHAGLDACLGDKGRPPLERVRRFFEMTQQQLPERGLHGLPAGRTRAGAVGRERGVPAQDRGVLLRDRRAHRRLPGRGRTAGRHPGRFRSAAHGEPAGRLLGGRRAAQPAARECRAADRDARLLPRAVSPGRPSPSPPATGAASRAGRPGSRPRRLRPCRPFRRRA